MMQKIKALFQEEKLTEAAYDAAEAAGDQKGMENARARHHELCKEAQENGKDFCSMLRLFCEMKERGNELIDLNDVHDAQVEEVIGMLIKFGVKKFTFSSTWSSAVTAAWEISRHGYRLEGMTQINSQYPEFRSNERKKIPAFVFAMNK